MHVKIIKVNINRIIKNKQLLNPQRKKMGIKNTFSGRKSKKEGKTELKKKQTEKVG